MDIVDKQTRSRMMSGIRGKDTKPELLVRHLLHKRGFRYRLHDRRLPGKPDLVLPKYNAVVFINGCFWHGHDCKLFKLPRTRVEFWETKITGNRERDGRICCLLKQSDWRVATVWECALRDGGTSHEHVVEALVEWLLEHDTSNNSSFLEIRG